MRTFIYKGVDRNVGKDSTFYILDFTTVHDSSSSWATYTQNSNLLVESSPTLSSDISNAIVDFFSGFINGVLHDGVRVGKVVEVLSDDIAKIKLYELGSVKKRMMLSTRRVYDWLNGGAELRIKDFEFILNSLKGGEEEKLRKLWAHYNEGDEFNLEEAKEIFSKNKSMIKTEIEKINQNLESGFYTEGTTTISDDLSYYLEVLDVKDSIVTAKVVGSSAPMYYIRVGDLVEVK